MLFFHELSKLIILIIKKKKSKLIIFARDADLRQIIRYKIICVVFYYYKIEILEDHFVSEGGPCIRVKLPSQGLILFQENTSNHKKEKKKKK